MSEKNRGGVQAVGGSIIEARDTFNRPADTVDYAANDVVAATTSNTGTTALRGVELARINAGTGYITYWQVETNNTLFVPRIRVFLYNVAAPTTALPGDNVAMAEKFANRAEFVASFDLPALATATGGDSNRAVRDDLRIPFKAASGDKNLYYRYVLLDASTNEASGQTFYTIARADAN